jgi:hypothetical protein
MDFKENVCLYERKINEPFTIPDGFQLAFDDQHGFFYANKNFNKRRISL